jgi:hypothetical protein
MKKQLLFPAAIIGILLASLAAALAQSPGPSYGPDPKTGLPFVTAGGGLSLDPATGLPMAPKLDPATGLPPEPQWIDTNWSDPAIVLTNVWFEGMPISEVVNQLNYDFKQTLNILPLPKTFGRDWDHELVQLHLKNVKASQIFNAMNLVFENDRTPLRWELRNSANSAGGGLSYVQLRVLPDAAGWHPSGESFTPPPASTQRAVYYVGNLIGDEKAGGLSMDQITKTILDIWPSDFGKPDGVIQFHKDAQLLVINGTDQEIEFVHQTLAALQKKAEAARPKTETDKDIDELNNLIKSLKSLGSESK